MSPTELKPARAGRIFPLKSVIALVAMLTLPVVAFLALDIGANTVCRHSDGIGGVLPGKIMWRSVEVTCGSNGVRYFDVSLGAVGKPLITAITSNAGAVPLAVDRLEDGRVVVRFDRPVGVDGGTDVFVKLKATGSPAERIDLQKPAS